MQKECKISRNLDVLSEVTLDKFYAYFWLRIAARPPPYAPLSGHEAFLNACATGY
jgi:hypothetical protein